MWHVQARDTRERLPEQRQCCVWRVGVRLGLVLLSALLVGTVTQVAAQPRSTLRVLSLDEALALAVKNSPQIKEEQFGVLQRQSQRRQADATRFAQLELTVVGAHPRGPAGITGGAGAIPHGRQPTPPGIYTSPGGGEGL